LKDNQTASVLLIIRPCLEEHEVSITEMTCNAVQLVIHVPTFQRNLPPPSTGQKTKACGEDSCRYSEKTEISVLYVAIVNGRLKWERKDTGR
jgi:hypothetical protein